ncbi:1,4-alpha-glucan branching protein GlgB [Pseudoalteromonas sp. T1lg48]|uniref:1,4-alpha-glucan branching protein GlgB n=1 Tax=Pseudoalteromonas sp. T1lg48 TaxID=2077100 RepID=UPI000CF67428|nr:1,4-alpha-glucan branching protein GlgB [Pseudoalteromonas sp. T1lg48]
MARSASKFEYPVNLDDALAALEQARVGEPRQLLGHQCIDGAWYILVYKPGAESVAVVFTTGTTEAQRYGDSALFLAPSKARFEPYELLIRYPHLTRQEADPFSLPLGLNADDLYYFRQGQEQQAQRHLGAHPMDIDGIQGVRFSVWAPNAQAVSVIGDFNHWDKRQHPLSRVDDSGVWAIFIPSVPPGSCYKFSIYSALGEHLVKADPYALAMEKPPATASIVTAAPRLTPLSPDYYEQRSERNAIDAPISIYEVHLGSWRRGENNVYLTYRELAEQLLPYVEDMGFTHIQLMPISEYPFDGSWGYQGIGLFAPSARFGSAEDFAYFCERCRTAGIGLLLDWVPGHFPGDSHGLARFDGTHLYEHADTRQGFHPDWHTYIYNYERQEVRSFLVSNATYWLEQFAVDGLRVDAVASMLYLDYSRENGQWLANKYGGRENLGAIDCLQQINSVCYARNQGIMMVAEESTAWPGVTNSVEHGGLGFGYKWNMGWMNDSLKYMQLDPIYRQYHHHEMTFSLVYAFSENFILPLSHDEVVHGKGSLLHKMPGDLWQKFANLRAYYGFMWAHPGKKLLFMGGEFAQHHEWNHDMSLQWDLLVHDSHQGIQRWVRDLNQVYRQFRALHDNDRDPNGFTWLDGDNSAHSIFSFVRTARDGAQKVVCVHNFTPQVHHDFRVPLPESGRYRVLLNSDDQGYGGSGVAVIADEEVGIDAEPVPWLQESYSLQLSLGPLASIYLLWEREVDAVANP